jgi:6-phospho-beta-glucosidase
VSLKLTVIGGGSSYTPELVEGLIKERQRLPVSQLTLLDVPAGQEKVEIIAGLARRMAAAAGVPMAVEVTLDPERALDGADLVVSQFRAGGLAGRQRDEHLPLRYGMLGQETTGPGGFANALRTIPQALALAEVIQRRAPKAWLVNFTNPSGIVTEALLRYGWPRTVGLCNVAIGVEKGVARALGVAEERITIESMGLNHLTWMRVRLDGKDITPQLLGLEGGGLVEGRPANLPQGEWPPTLLRALGLLPNGYLHYYYETDRAVAAERAALERGEGTRADRVMALEAELFRLYRDPNLDHKPPQLAQRGGAYYSEAAVRLMVGLNGGETPVQVLNVQNRGAMPELPDEAVVEVACRVDREGAHPVPPGPMPEAIRGLVQAVKAYEQQTVEAARTGDRLTAYRALISHPLVRSVSDAERLLDDILRENAPLLPAFAGRP